MPGAKETNPLRTIQFRIPFDRIRAADVEPAVAELVSEARARLDAIAAEPGPRTFDNTMGELDALGKKRLKEIDVELAQITTKFSENVLDSTNAFELVIANEADLSGLPPTARASARESAARKGREGWRFTLQAPDYFAIATYL